MSPPCFVLTPCRFPSGQANSLKLSLDLTTASIKYQQKGGPSWEWSGQPWSAQPEKEFDLPVFEIRNMEINRIEIPNSEPRQDLRPP